jgi:hypothetical protein
VAAGDDGATTFIDTADDLKTRIFSRADDDDEEETAAVEDSV